MIKDNLTWLIPLLLIIGFLLYKKLGQVPKAEAVQLLHDGALLVDVRSSGEYSSDPVSGAVNVPLDSLESRIPAVAPDKSHPILVHCLSGTRSSFAARTLRKLGYTNVHDIGSVGRARALAAEAAGTK